MRNPRSTILPLFRSNAQAKILATLFLEAPEEGLSLKALAEASGVALSQTHRELRRLEEVGIVSSRRVGNVRLVRPEPTSPFYEELASLLTKAFGPVPVLRDHLGPIGGIEGAYVYGSWAERYLGQPGRIPGDIDVLIVGSPDIEDVYEATRRAEQRLGREVNPTVVSAEEWQRPSSGFLQTLKSRPLVPVLGEES